MNGNGTVLSAADHEHFLEHGYVVVANAVSPETISAVLPELEEDNDKGRDLPGIRACASERLIAAVAELFGPGNEPVRKTSGRDMVRPYEPEAEWAGATAHVDDAYPTLMPNGWAIGCFLFLTRVRSRGGAFIFFPGSPWRNRGLMEENWQAAKDAVALPENSGPPREFLAEPGDAILFHHLMGHCGSPNVSDPEVTRHAVLTRWCPQRRIVPGMKPLAGMTTVEKANSARYSAHRRQRPQPAPTGDDPETCAVLAEGLPGLGSVAACALLHHGGGVHLFHAADHAAGVSHLFSRDLVRWERRPVAGIAAAKVRSLEVHQYGLDVILAVTSPEGRVVLHSSRDCAAWRETGIVDGCETATPWFTYFKYASKLAKNHTLFTVPVGRPEEILCTWGERWEEAAAWKTQSLAARAPEGRRIADVTIAAQYSETECAFVADLGDPAGEGTLPHYALTRDTAAEGVALKPLPFCGVSAPRSVRVLNRAQSYWLVGFLGRSPGGDDRLFWGAIDWSLPDPALVRLDSPDSLDEARAIVGLL